MEIPDEKVTNVFFKRKNSVVVVIVGKPSVEVIYRFCLF